MIENGLRNVMDLIKRQKWEKLFKRRELVHVDAVKEFYAKLTMSHNRKKDVSRTKVRGVKIVFDHMNLASILGVPGNHGICEYIKEVWEESRYTKPLEITRNFANNNTIMEARRVKSVEMKPFQRFIHFLVMKNVVPRFGKRDTTSYMDLIYMDHLIARRLVNLPREFSVPLVDKKGDEPKRDDEIEAPAEEALEEEKVQNDFDWKAVIDEAAVQGESGSDDEFFDAQVDVEEPVTEAPAAPAFPASPGDSTNQQKEQKPSRVDTSGPSGHITETVMIKLQAEFERARANRIQSDLDKAQAENARLLALLQQA
ncbi:hypothetical protein Dimus_007928 [Dionaea muscipula]